MLNLLITNTQDAQYTQVVAKPNRDVLIILYLNPFQGQKTCTHGGNSQAKSAGCRSSLRWTEVTAHMFSCGHGLLRCVQFSNKSFKSAGGWNLGGQGVPSPKSLTCPESVTPYS